jgi:hypothetical protein
MPHDSRSLDLGHPSGRPEHGCDLMVELWVGDPPHAVTAIDQSGLGQSAPVGGHVDGTGTMDRDVDLRDPVLPGRARCDRLGDDGPGLLGEPELMVTDVRLIRQHKPAH